MDQKLRAEADVLLERTGLCTILESCAPISIVGSYALRLMVWRDLDVAMNAPGLAVAEYFELGKRIADAAAPWKMFFTNNRNGESSSDPKGLYWGIRLGAIGEAWKIDLWAFETAHFEEKIRQCEDLKSRLNERNRLTVLQLKSHLWNHPQYRDAITSQDVYDAVLDDNASNLEEFWRYIQHKNS